MRLRAFAPIIDAHDALRAEMKMGREMQIMLSLKYRELRLLRAPLPSFDDVEFRRYSQNGEDGILLFIFSILGTTNKTVVEICAGNGIECNAGNLIINHGWQALLFDGNDAAINSGRTFYRTCPDTFVWPPKLVTAWVTRENVNQLIQENGISGEIDLLSLDLDGNDYWIWEAIDCIQPRVVVLEYQNMWPASEAVSIPYRPDFIAEWGAEGPDYGGASLAAFVKLARTKGYRLVGSQRYGFNAFFIRAGIGEEDFSEVDAASCLQHPQALHAAKHRLPRVINRPWVEV